MNYLTKLFQNENAKLFGRYVIFAGIATLVDLGFLYVFTEFFHIWYFYSAGISYLLGMLVNYSLNKYLNFENKNKKIIQQFGLFAIVAMVGLGLNQFIIYLLVEFALISYMAAKVAAVFAVMLWSFYGHKKFTFKILQ